MPRSHAVIFDIDGVLLHLTRQEETAFFNAFRQVAKIPEHHINPDWNSYRVRNDVAIAGELLERHLQRPPDDSEVRAVLDHYIETIADGLKDGVMRTEVIPGSLQLLNDLSSDTRLHLGLATANIEGTAVTRLKHAGLWGCFTACGYAESGGPKIEILGAAIAGLCDRNGNSVPADRVVFLGDQLGDLAAARENGVHFIGVSTKPQQRQVLQDNGATMVIADHAESARIIADVLEL